MAATSPAGVRTLHPNYRTIQPKWSIIRDVLEGEARVKYRREVYLPKPRTDGDATKDEERYQSYLQRAVFYNATARTLTGIVGQVFSKPPVTEFPAQVKYLHDDPAGTGITLEQQAKTALKDLLSMGRGGLWVDYPETQNGSTVAELATGLIRPTIRYFKPENILNWRSEKRGSVWKLALVVLQAEVEVAIDAFSVRLETQYIVLRLSREDIYSIEYWSVDNKGRYVSSGTKVPVDNDAKTFDTIPFVFIGVENNDPTVDDPPLYDLATLNIGHYRNSADYEESCFMVGQPTPWFSGVDQTWINTVWKGRVYLGSRGGVPLPSGGLAGLLQASPNQLTKDAMDSKERQMVALGARLVQEKAIQRTATEAGQDKVSEVSVIASAARNTSAAYMQAFAFCAKYSGSADKIRFELATDYDISRLTSQEIVSVVAAWQSKAITFDELRDNLRKGGIAFQSVQEALSAGLQSTPPEPTNTQNKQERVDNRAKSGA